jgi:hypothetical protein
VGIADHGRQNKSMPLAQFLPLLDNQQVILSRCSWDTARRTARRVFAPQIGDFADTAAIIEQLDLVISVDTSVVHLAGALGKPVWVLMRAESAPFSWPGRKCHPGMPACVSGVSPHPATGRPD